MCVRVIVLEGGRGQKSKSETGDEGGLTKGGRRKGDRWVVAKGADDLTYKIGVGRLLESTEQVGQSSERSRCSQYAQVWQADLSNTYSEVWRA